MRILLLAIAILLTPAAEQTLSQAERDHAIAELEGSRKMFLEATSGLSEAQWNFKPAPDRWTVAECAEHIGVTEAFILKMITEQALKGPAEPGKRTEVQGKDSSIMVAGVDRSAKFKAPEVIQPTRRWRAHPAGVLVCVVVHVGNRNVMRAFGPCSRVIT